MQAATLGPGREAYPRFKLLEIHYDAVRGLELGTKFEIGEDLDHQRREWRFEVAGWLAGAFVVALALVGLLGPGPLSSTKVLSPDGVISAEYQKYTRKEARREILLRLSGAAVRDGALRLSISHNFSETVSIESIHPEPRETVSGEDHLTYVFPVAGASGVEVKLRFEPDRLGPHEYVIAAGNGSQIRLSTFVLP